MPILLGKQLPLISGKSIRILLSRKNFTEKNLPFTIPVLHGRGKFFLCYRPEELGSSGVLGCFEFSGANI